MKLFKSGSTGQRSSNARWFSILAAIENGAGSKVYAGLSKKTPINAARPPPNEWPVNEIFAPSPKANFTC
ncbi:hypothetical protein [Chitiniphilus eburneus]|uniref:Uncharacterized protein n=1 Tax=Chitiniphilus eburneus TaxID=2571148 RepID=A0A4U0Q1N1_9NEIS|nr:hypothetical protein [Chitiniphilus eburneus]TJZ74819.1 hypothetical protein FAZ21_07560 [Chitiniphilus eburneus]